MTSYRLRIFLAAALAAIAVSAGAQSGTNSPYSQYGLGELAEQGNGFNKGMAGLGVAFNNGNEVNYINPASYSSVDSLSFIFDVGASGQLTNFSENGRKVNVKNADFEYVVGGFRACRGVGVAFGVLPVTNVGYDYGTTGKLSEEISGTYNMQYKGSGGLHEAFVGAAWSPFKGLSVGANIGYLWGTSERSVSTSYSNSSASTLSRYYSWHVNSYKLDAGVQYTLKANSKNSFTLGASWTMGHKLGADAECMEVSANSSTSVSDTTRYTAKDALSLPSIYSGGVMWNHANRLRIGVDYSLQKWGSESYPSYHKGTDASGSHYYSAADCYLDRHKVTLGGEYCQNPYGRRFIDRMRFRAGAYYATPYQRINGQDGPKEISVTAGFGIPIMNSYNNRSILNISGQWVQRSADNLLKENSFRINIGITFNERWFMKWKVE